MPLVQIPVPNIPDSNQLLNDSYTDRSSATHTGMVAEDNRIRDFIANIQENVSSIVTSLEGRISSNSGAVSGMISTVSALNSAVSVNTEDISENSGAIISLTLTLQSDVDKLQASIDDSSKRIDSNASSITRIDSDMSSLRTSVNSFSSYFAQSMSSKALRVIGDYQFLSQLPSFSGASSEGSFATVGHAPEPEIGDSIYQAAYDKWMKVPDWNLVSIKPNLADVPVPSSAMDIVAIGTNGSYILYQPTFVTDDMGNITYSYSEDVPLGTPSSIVAQPSSLPAISAPEGSMSTFQYHYSSLVSDAEEGEFAYVDNVSYKFSGGKWVQETPRHKFIVIAWKGSWIPLNTGSGAGGGKGVSVIKLTSNSKPSTIGVSNLDMAYYEDSSGVMNSMWLWSGSSWLTVPITPYVDQMSFRSGNNLKSGMSSYLVNQMKTDLINLLYPVGSVYMSMNSTNPSSLFGGSWTQTAQGRMIVGVDSGDTDFNASMKTGGEKTHTLTINEMPSHSHKSTTYGGVEGFSYKPDSAGANASAIGNNPTNSVGGGAAHNNMSPYVTAYIWRRTA